MAPREKTAAQPREQAASARKPSSRDAAGAGSTREAVREIVRRYRETFERLGR